MDVQPDRPITPEVSPPDRRKLLRHRTLIKLAAIFVLSLCMLIPLALLGPVVDERAALRDAAVAEVHDSWGSSQRVFGPLLVVPMRNGKRAYALPDELRAHVELVPERRSRGIYATVVFTAKLEVTGKLSRPTAGELGIPPDQLLWEQAFVAMAISDLRGVAEEVPLRWGNATIAMQPGSWLQRWGSGLHAPVKLGDDSVPFAIELSVRGSDGVWFAPLGLRNVVTARSSWPSPRFAGTYLPTTRDVTDQGFDATWAVSHYGRNYPQRGHGDLPELEIDQSSFGIALMPSIDSYRSVDRAIKYGVLFVVLAFMSFFLFEVVARVRIHPFQYAMVGLALGVFFLLLLALSEVVPFVAAYATSSAATIGLVTGYMLPVLKTGRRSLIALAALAVSFTVLYIVLQAEDYALVAGSGVVFVALTVAMLLSRKVDWYADDAQAAPPASE